MYCPNKVRTPPVTSTSNVASGYVGELFGTLRSGTGGFTYSTRTTTAPTTSIAAVVSLTLNKGVYLVSVVMNAGASVSTFMAGDVTVGGTQVTTNNMLSVSSSSTSYGTLSVCLPVIISSDSTVVAGRAYFGAGTSTGAVHEMWAVRIA